MSHAIDTLQNELLQLSTTNEELLRSKGMLMQEIIELKKKLETETKNKRVIEQQLDQISQLNIEIVDHLLHRSILSGQIDELKRNLSLTELQKVNAFAEIERLKKRKWYQRILNK